MSNTVYNIYLPLFKCTPMFSCRSTKVKPINQLSNDKAVHPEHKNKQLLQEVLLILIISINSLYKL